MSNDFIVECKNVYEVTLSSVSGVSSFGNVKYIFAKDLKELHEIIKAKFRLSQFQEAKLLGEGYNFSKIEGVS